VAVETALALLADELLVAGSGHVFLVAQGGSWTRVPYGSCIAWTAVACRILHPCHLTGFAKIMAGLAAGGAMFVRWGAGAAQKKILHRWVQEMCSGLR
jgi:hypothetical protein